MIPPSGDFIGRRLFVGRGKTLPAGLRVNLKRKINRFVFRT